MLANLSGMQLSAFWLGFTVGIASATSGLLVIRLILALKRMGDCAGRERLLDLQPARDSASLAAQGVRDAQLQQAAQSMQAEYLENMMRNQYWNSINNERLGSNHKYYRT